MPGRRKAMIWSNGGKFTECIYASLGPNLWHITFCKLQYLHTMLLRNDVIHDYKSIRLAP